MSEQLSEEGAGASNALDLEETAGPEPIFTSPPAVYIEPDVPDPFLIDDEDISDSESESTPTESQHTIAPVQDVSLSAPPVPTSPNPLGSPLQPLNLNKDVPRPPQSDSDEEDAPEI